MESYEQGSIPNPIIVPLKTRGMVSEAWYHSWINLERWSWWFKWGAIYTILVYVALIISQFVGRKETRIEKLQNMIERDEKWAEVQHAYDNHTGVELEEEEMEVAPVPATSKLSDADLAKMPWIFRPFLFFFRQTVWLFSYLNGLRIVLLENIWGFSKDTVADFAAKRSRRMYQ